MGTIFDLVKETLINGRAVMENFAITPELIINIVRTIATIYIIIVGVESVNRMSGKTHHLIRYAFAILTTGAFCNLFIIWKPGNWQTRDSLGFDIYDLMDVIWVVGVAIYVGASQRRKIYKADHEHLVKA